MKEYIVAVLGATGAVGREMLKVLEERDFPVKKLIPLASAKSEGSMIRFKGEDIPVQKAHSSAFEGVDIVFGATNKELAREFAPFIVKAGAVFVDNTCAFRMEEDVPLVVPEINGEDVKLHKGIIASPNCSTTIALMAIKSIADISPIKSMIVSTYQAVSGAGAEGPVELAAQAKAISNGEPVDIHKFKHQIAYNLIPQIGGFDETGYTAEEMKMQNEGRRILHNPKLNVTCTCVRVPVMRSHSISIQLRTQSKVSVAQAREAISKFAGCKLQDDPQNGIYPMPLEASDKDTVFVGRIRDDLTDDCGLALWCCGDQIRKGAATNAVQIAELLA